jgi:hypothetical protein
MLREVHTAGRPSGAESHAVGDELVHRQRFPPVLLAGQVGHGHSDVCDRKRFARSRAAQRGASVCSREARSEPRMSTGRGGRGELWLCDDPPKMAETIS